MLYARKYEIKSKNRQRNEPREFPNWGKQLLDLLHKVRQHKVLNSSQETSRQGGKDHQELITNSHPCSSYVQHLQAQNPSPTTWSPVLDQSNHWVSTTHCNQVFRQNHLIFKSGTHFAWQGISWPHLRLILAPLKMNEGGNAVLSALTVLVTVISLWLQSSRL